MSDTVELLQAILMDPARRSTRYAKYNMLEHVSRINCVNGLSFSLQASRAHYCFPRDNSGPWESVEIGYPTARVDDFMPFAEDPVRPTETVYAGVPLDVAARVIDANGGFKR